MNKLTRFVFVAVLLLQSLLLQAQPAMAETMRNDGKIYVVVGVVVLIFAVLFIYLMLIDKRLKKLEKGE